MNARDKSTGGADPESKAPKAFTGVRELIVITKLEAGLRAPAGSFASTKDIDITSLNALLQESSATILPLFGDEEHLARSISSFPSLLRGTSPLTTFYSVQADDARLDSLADQLRAHNLIEAAYVKPASEPPIFDEAMPQAAPNAAPPITPDFSSRQLYLEAAVGGIDARYAWTCPGGKGQGVGIIDIEGAWNFSHEDMLQNQGG